MRAAACGGSALGSRPVAGRAIVAGGPGGTGGRDGQGYTTFKGAWGSAGYGETGSRQSDWTNGRTPRNFSHEIPANAKNRDTTAESGFGLGSQGVRCAPFARRREGPAADTLLTWGFPGPLCAPGDPNAHRGLAGARAPSQNPDLAERPPGFASSPKTPCGHVPLPARKTRPPRTAPGPPGPLTRPRVLLAYTGAPCASVMRSCRLCTSSFW